MYSQMSKTPPQTLESATNAYIFAMVFASDTIAAAHRTNNKSQLAMRYDNTYYLGGRHVDWVWATVEQAAQAYRKAGGTSNAPYWDSVPFSAKKGGETRLIKFRKNWLSPIEYI